MISHFIEERRIFSCYCFAIYTGADPRTDVSGVRPLNLYHTPRKTQEIAQTIKMLNEIEKK